jgi:hypothetical protein
MIRTSTRSRLALAALATIAASFGPATLAQAKQTCKPKHSSTLASDSYARVYGKNGNAYVCVRASGRTTLLQGASSTGDQFALGGKYVGWSSSPAPDPTNPSLLPHSIVTVMHIPDRFINDQWYPFELNETADKIVVLSDGAAAWAMTPPASDGSFTEVQGTDRMGHPADQFSDDHADVVGSSLRVLSGKTITWQYVDGTSGTQTLF